MDISRVVRSDVLGQTEEWRCSLCGDWFPTDDIVFTDKQGRATVMFGDPYCVRCCPQQPEEDYD